MTPTPHDALVKSTFSQPEHMAGELRAVLPAALAARIDLASLRLESGSFVDEELRERWSDLLYTARIGDRAALVYVLFEHQSTSDKLMAFRLLRYMVRIWEGYLKDNPGTALPAILPVVLHHDEQKWNAGTSFEALLDLEPEDLPHVAAFVPRFSFLLDDLSAVSDEALRERAASALARLTLSALKHARVPEDVASAIERLLPLMVEVARSEGGVSALQAIFQYLVQTKPPSDRTRLLRITANIGADMQNKIRTQADAWLEEGIEKGMEKGIEKGRVEGRVERAQRTLLRLLTLKFGPVEAEVRARIVAADEDTLERWTERVLIAPQVEAIFDPA